MKNAIILILLLAAIGSMIFILLSPDKTEVEPPEPTAAAETQYVPAAGGGTGELEPLRAIIEDELAKQTGDWAVYVENTGTGSSFAVNDHRMAAASLIKLFIMGEVCSEIAAGNIRADEVDPYLERMITVSDNESSNVLVSKLGHGTYTDMRAQDFIDGMVKVNGFARSLGCLYTEQQRDLKNSRPVPIPEQNYTSVKDCGRFLSALYHRKLVLPELDMEMTERLKRQTRRGKIPAGIPSGVVCANKTGELSNVENDAAIVYSPACDYIICVMSGELTDTAGARETITGLSETVYKFFNEQ